MFNVTVSLLDAENEATGLFAVGNYRTLSESHELNSYKGSRLAEIFTF